MTPHEHDDDYFIERRSGYDRRLKDLEEKYNAIYQRLDGLDALKNQIAGALAFIRFVGWSGMAAGIVMFLRYMMTVKG